MTLTTMLSYFRKHLVAPLQQAWTRWQRDDCNLLAAAIAYYTSLGIFPLMLVLISVLGVILHATALGQDAQQQIGASIAARTSAALAEQVEAALLQVQDKAKLGGPLGIVGLILAAMAIFAQFERAFNRVWNTPDRSEDSLLGSIRNMLIDRLRAFLMLSSLGGALVVVFIANLALTSIRAYTVDLLPFANTLYSLLQFLVSVVLNSLVLGAIYKWLPKAPVRWREALQGGLLVALCWEAGRWALAIFVIGTRFSSADGIIGAFIALLLWVYYAVAVIFFGAEYVQSICRHCEPSAHERPTP